MMRFRKEDALLLIIDLQERLVPVLAEPESLIRYTNVLQKMALHYGMPILVTEQYPRGLGATVPELEISATKLPIIEKIKFTAYVPEVAAALEASGKRQIIVTGAETHICVYQSVLDLMAAGYEVFVPRDAVSSRTIANKENALENFARAGAWVTNAETLLFEALGEAGTPDFKFFSGLIK